MNGLKDWEESTLINTYRAPAYAALGELKKKGKCLEATLHRQVEYLDNVVNADQGKLKPLVRPLRSIKALKMADATIKGFEVRHALRKGQASAGSVHDQRMRPTAMK